jgi:hypothetical protein
MFWGTKWAMMMKTGTNDASGIVCALGMSFFYFYLLTNDFIFYLDSNYVLRYKVGDDDKTRHKWHQTHCLCPRYIFFHFLSTNYYVLRYKVSNDD